MDGMSENYQTCHWNVMKSGFRYASEWPHQVSFTREINSIFAFFIRFQGCFWYDVNGLNRFKRFGSSCATFINNLKWARSFVVFHKIYKDDSYFMLLLLNNVGKYHLEFLMIILKTYAKKYWKICTNSSQTQFECWLSKWIKRVESLNASIRSHQRSVRSGDKINRV